jgi:plastocyanin
MTLVLVTAVIQPLAPGPAEAATARVALAGTQFTPPRLEIAVGDTVVWEAGDEGHTVTARDGTFDSSPRGLMSEGDQYRFRFRVPGSFPYFCRVHQTKGMQGEIEVIDPFAPTTTTTRLTPVTAAATTSSTATTTTLPATTTSRELATSSTTSPSVATATTAPPGTPAVPQEAPAVNPNARVVGSPPPDAALGSTEAAARSTGHSSGGPGPAVFVGLLAAVGIVGAGAVRMAVRRRPATARARRR